MAAVYAALGDIAGLRRIWPDGPPASWHRRLSRAASRCNCANVLEWLWQFGVAPCATCTSLALAHRCDSVLDWLARRGLIADISEVPDSVLHDVCNSVPFWITAVHRKRYHLVAWLALRVPIRQFFCAIDSCDLKLLRVLSRRYRFAALDQRDAAHLVWIAAHDFAALKWLGPLVPASAFDDPGLLLRVITRQACSGLVIRSPREYPRPLAALNWLYQRGASLTSREATAAAYFAAATFNHAMARWVVEHFVVFDRLILAEVIACCAGKTGDLWLLDWLAEKTTRPLAHLNRSRILWNACWQPRALDWLFAHGCGEVDAGVTMLPMVRRAWRLHVRGRLALVVLAGRRRGRHPRLPPELWGLVADFLGG